MKKKIISLLTGLVMVVGLVGVMPVVSVGAENFENAINYTLGSTQHGSITHTTSRDFYEFTIKSSGKVNISFSGNLEYISLNIYDSMGKLIWYSLPSWNEINNLIVVSDSLDLTKGIYYFVIEKTHNRVGSYNFKLDFVNASESFTETGNGTNNSMYSANSIALNNTYRGQIAKNDSVDFYKFTIWSSEEVDISFVGELENIGLYIYDSEGTSIYYNYPHWNDITHKSTVYESIYLSKGTYYFAVKQNELDNSTGNYYFNLYPKINSVSNFKASAISSSAITLKWDKVSGAQGYIVYKYDNSKKTWVRVAKIKSNSYTVNKLKSGTSYKFAVKAYKTVNGKEVTSSKFPTVTATTLLPNATSLKTSSVSSTAVKLTWNKVSGAQGYIVYKYDNSKKTWVRAAKTKTTANTYTVSKLKSGTSYKFAVKAYKTVNGKEVTSSKFPTVTAITKLPAVVNGRTSIGKNSVKLTWKKTTGAQGYIVYKYNNAKKTWVRVAKTKSLNYTVKKLKANTNYRFAVKAYKYVNKKEITSVSFKTISVKTKK